MLALALLMLTVMPAGDDTAVIICRSDPPAAGLRGTVITPGGLVKEAYTGRDGVARIYLRPAPGLYHAQMQSSEETYWFELSPVVELVFRLGPAQDTPTPIYTPLWTATLPPPIPQPTPTPTPTPYHVRLRAELTIDWYPNQDTWFITGTIRSIE